MASNSSIKIIAGAFFSASSKAVGRDRKCHFFKTYPLTKKITEDHWGLPVIASCYHRQYFIASSMKYGRGRPGRSGHMRCHQADTWLTHRGWCPMKNLDVLCCTVRPKAGCQSVHKADDRYRSLFTAPGTDQCEYNGWAPPPVCLPSVYLTSSHVARSPRPSPAVFHTGSDQILVVGTAWERG